MECLERYPYLTAGVIAVLLSLVFGLVMQHTLLDKSQRGVRAYSLGVLECIIFMAAFSGAGTMGAAWLGFKVASKWKSWTLFSANTEDEKVKDLTTPKEVGRQYRSFLVGTAVNLVIGLVTAGIASALSGKAVPWP